LRQADDVSVLVSVTRVLNEDDIIEAFVRHTLGYVNCMLIMDNGSIDRTMEILTALRAEGLPLILLQSQSVAFNEQQHNTMLYQTACKAFTPDWVLCLDSDEFIDTRAVDVRTRLAAVPPETTAVKLSLRNYFAEGTESTDLLVPRRMVMRDVEDRGVHKCLVRGTIDDGVTIDAGNHDAWLGDNRLPSILLPELPLAHFPDRHPLQFLTKALLGRMKVLAAGGGEDIVRQRNNHYTNFLDIMCHDPAHLLRNPAYMNAALPGMPLVEDPIHYLGSDLRYTIAPDPLIKAIRCLATGMERVASSHGRLLDADPALRARIESEAMQTQLLTG
jgi:glycosyltransferase involved in cell wall biosynthesis